jgi:hypothetical protein
MRRFTTEYYRILPPCPPRAPWWRLFRRAPGRETRQSEPIPPLRPFVARNSRNDVADPTQDSARADPEARRHDQPEDATSKFAVVGLSDTRDDQAENGRRSRILCCLRHHLMLR